MDFSIKFLGGLATTDNLTGSCMAIEVRCGKKTTTFLVDVGLVQGDFKNFFKNNTRLLDSIDPKKIDCIIMTHAHIDHIGLLPLLVSKGFKGKVICTQPTADLMPIMLEDSYKVQKELAARRRKRETPRQPKKKRGIKSRSRQPRETGLLFTYQDVEKATDLILQSGFAFRTPIKLSKEIALKFYPSGHILGSAICIVEITNPKSKKIFRLGFSGDLGRQEGLLLFPPVIVKEQIDYWFTESTYGDKDHPERDNEIEKFYKLIINAKENGKKIIIPSFALERSQEIIYLLTAAMHNGKIPQSPIYLDSPMAIRITGVFAKYWDLGTFKNKYHLDFNPFNEENRYLRFIQDPDESMRLANEPGPFIVIASSGMCDAGRVRDHLRAGLPSGQTIVCLVGFMAPTSLGEKLKVGCKTIRMNDEEIAIRATVESFESFSAHGDSSELVGYARSVMANSSGRSIGILHGEISGGTALKEKLGAEFNDRDIEIFIPNMKDSRKIKLS